MKSLFAIAVILFTFSGVSFGQKGDNYGKGVKLTKKTKVSAIFTTPKNFIGKTVLVEGQSLMFVQKEDAGWKFPAIKKVKK
ncbi:MAG: hypothetical protein IPJ75_18345 [Ignavibacteriales bacterium]|nr:hypothetical protein [Ignavibacteriales bacterium]